MPPKLYLIGAGPGDPELLTLKAVRALRECDIVLYDRLVSPETLAFAPPHAERIYVGKRECEQHAAQSRIFDLVREHAAAGKTIARLKGGDPFVFGRGGEEWLFAHELGIPVEIVPGVSAAVAAPALAGIPLTWRNVSQSFAVVTGHCGAAVQHDWSRYTGVDTLVVLMGVAHRAAIAEALIAAGRAPDEPAAFIERATLPDERIVESTLAAVAAGRVDVESPAVFVIGPVVRLRRALAVSEPAQPELIPVPEA